MILQISNYKIVQKVKILCLAALATFMSHQANAQLKVGENASTIHPDAILELQVANKGMLIPRVPLVARDSAAPLSTHAAGMLVYNTATSGTGTNSVSPGFYYNDGAKWVKVSDAAQGDPTKDAWIDDDANTQVKLGTLSNGATARPDTAAVVIKDNGRMGIGLINPAGILDIKGRMYVNNQQTVYNASALDTTFSGSIFIGNGGRNLASTSSREGKLNSSLGIDALRENTTGAENTAIGSWALRDNTAGTGNTATGAAALSGNLTGFQNAAFGLNALRTNTTGSFNTALGSQAVGNGPTPITGRYNTAVGFKALPKLTTGNYNTIVGSTDSLTDLSYGHITTGSYNTVLGYNFGNGITTGSNNLILGARITGLGNLSNNIVIADGAGTQRIRVLDNGNTGIGETAPSAKLEVNGNLEISTVDNVGNDIPYKPLVWNTVTHRVETTPANGNNINKSLTIAAGATAVVHTLTTSFASAYDIKVFVENFCGASSYNKFIASGSSAANGYWAINHVGGVSEDGASTVTAGTKNSKSIHNPLSLGCADGGTSNALDFTISVNVTTGQVSITNNGNISRTYEVVIEKAFD